MGNFQYPFTCWNPIGYVVFNANLLLPTKVIVAIL